MAKMGKYCKAIPLLRLRQFDGWKENARTANEETRHLDDSGSETPPQLTDSDFLFLQSDYTVTRGVFLDENVVFDGVTPEWIKFCTEELKFEIPHFAQ